MQRKVLKPKNFPSLLKEIPSPPEELYLIGGLPSDDALFIGVVGSRKFSNYGKESCEKIISGLKNSSREIIIVSGMAIGIDGIAHKAALRNNLKTVAIPGSGLDDKVLHPRSNIELSKEIAEKGGCLLSEFPWDMPASVYTFPQRNRIIAGLSHGVLIIEAAEKSGALITANLALEFNRNVMAVPGSIFSENSKGANNLIKAGATPVFSAEDILDAFDVPHETKNLQLNFTPTEQQIFSALTEPMQKDDLIRKLDMPSAKINPVISMMILNGAIKESGGEIFRV